MNLILITSLLYLLINDVSLANASTGVHFSYNSITGWKDVKYYGDTTIYNNILQLTGPTSDEYGWVTYSTSIPLVDGVTGEPASFLTHFSFIINTSSSDGYGLAFFMSPKVGPISSCSSAFGLFSERDYLDSSQNQMVAVEFDTYYDDVWDPGFNHVGIDVNSIYSVVVHEPESTIMTNGTLTHAWVSYSAGKQLLNVYLNYQGDSESPAGDPILSYKINLTQVLSNTVMVGFSAASYAEEVHQILSWEFNSTFGSNTSPSLKPKSRPEVYTVVLCTIAVMVVLGGTGWFLVWLKNSLIKKREDCRELPRKYSYKELVVATSNFSEKNKLGEGGFGPVFKGYLRDSCDDVAVKCLKQQSDRGTKQFKAEVDILSKLRHPNLVELFGWSEENGELLLVYKYMPNGSLDSPLFDMHRLLLWPKRYEIVLDLTDALCYLQVENECNKEVVHRDIKPENVLLDSSLHAKLSDFGLARLVDHGLSAETTILAGSLGFIAPELFSHDDRINKPSTQSDIYSFGIVLLEIACGRRPVDLDLTRFVWEHYERNKLLKAADERLKGEYNAKEIERVMFVGLWCAHPVASDRPDIGLARKALKFEDCKLPVLPNYPRLLSERVIGGGRSTGASMWSSEEVV